MEGAKHRDFIAGQGLRKAVAMVCPTWERARVSQSVLPQLQPCAGDNMAH